MAPAVEARKITSSTVKAEAAALGFDLCGIAPAKSFPELEYLPEWLERGYAGEMLRRTPPDVDSTTLNETESWHEF